VAELLAETMYVCYSDVLLCGNYHPHASTSRCTCREQERKNYRSRVRGPIADRIDITRHLQPLTQADRDQFSRPETTAEVRARVEAARLRQQERYAGAGWRLNAQVPGAVLRDRWPLTRSAQRLVDNQMFGGRLSQRGGVRVHRLAWTVADLSGVEQPGEAEAEVALRLRSGDPLLVATLQRRAG